MYFYDSSHVQRLRESFGSSQFGCQHHWRVRILSADAVKEALTDNATVVVDARTNGAFNGWAAGENKMGGHIDGATDFSANWLTCTFDDKNNLNGMTREEHLEKYMDDKKITTDTQVIVYDENGKDLVATGIGQLPATLIYSYLGGILPATVKTAVSALLTLFAFFALVALFRKVKIRK